MIIVRLLSPGPWLVGTTKVYSGVGADIVMESMSNSRLGPFRRLPLADRLRRNQAPSPAHGGPVIFIGGSTKEAYLIVLTMSTAVGPGQPMRAEPSKDSLE